ncbi:hypothetical protein DPEC_G00328630 [Dallia pectoralis]|uniref:Uncharacterized protein n=1 Tax=Dallia pectoralis TaxID=75939 RepID=A0ACC2F8S4_DALPE|nr:hypothetical protein DPEC_G00328630 [Dallia pectoralis]
MKGGDANLRPIRFIAALGLVYDAQVLLPTRTKDGWCQLKGHSLQQPQTSLQPENLWRLWRLSNCSERCLGYWVIATKEVSSDSPWMHPRPGVTDDFNGDVTLERRSKSLASTLPHPLTFCKHRGKMENGQLYNNNCSFYNLLHPFSRQFSAQLVEFLDTYG